MKRDLELPGGLVIPAHELRLEYSRSSGPGGQHVNRTESRVTVRFDLELSPSIPESRREWMIRRLRSRLTQSGEILISCERHRERSRNEDEALDRLEQLLRWALQRPRPRKKTRPTRASVERRLSTKRRAARTKQQRRRPGPDD